MDPLRVGVFLGPEPTEEDKERARLKVCAESSSPEEATEFLKMLGLL